MNHDQLPNHTRQHADKEAMLLDQCRAAEAALYGKRIELAMHAGLRDDADHWRKAMEHVIALRRFAALGEAEKRGECFFTAAGAYDGQQSREAVHG